MSSLANTRLVEDWCLSKLICPKCHSTQWKTITQSFEFNIQCQKCTDCFDIQSGNDELKKAPGNTFLRLPVSPSILYDRLENFCGIFRYMYLHIDMNKSEVISAMITEPITSHHLEEMTEFGIPVFTPMFLNK